MRRLNLDDKQAQNITLTTIIIIALGLAVLVFLIWGFSTGWSNFWETIIGYGGSDVENVRQSCAVACSKMGAGEYDFCEKLRTVEYENGDIARGSCSQLDDVESCPDIDCNPDDEPKGCVGDKGEEKDKCETNEEEITDVAVSKGKVCCVSKDNNGNSGDGDSE